MDEFSARESGEVERLESALATAEQRAEEAERDLRIVMWAAAEEWFQRSRAQSRLATAEEALREWLDVKWTPVTVEGVPCLRVPHSIVHILNTQSFKVLDALPKEEDK